MKLLCLLLALGFAAGSDKGPGSYLTIDILRGLVDGLETDLRGVADDVSEVTTLCAFGEEALLEIDDFFIPYMTTTNEQQYELIATCEAQVKELQHEWDDAKADEKKALELARATENSLDSQINNYLDGPEVSGVNAKQQTEIDKLETSVKNTKSEFIDDVKTTIAQLALSEDTTRSQIDRLNEFVDKRKCQFGSGIISPEGKTAFYFEVPFDVTPNVSLSLTGFRAHLDIYGYGEDTLNLNKMVSHVKPTYFEVSATDKSTGMVDVKDLSCSWMACQNLEEDVNLDHTSHTVVFT